MRPGGVAAGAGEPDEQPVGGGGQRADAQADLADLQPRVAVQAVNTPYAVQPARGDHPERTAGHDLLGRLEDHPHPPVQLPVARHAGQHQRRTEQCRRVYVVTARMSHPVERRPPRSIHAVRHRQRVDVGPQRDAGVTGPDVADQPGPGRQHPRRQSGLDEPLLEQFGRPHLVPPELRVRVQIAPYVDHVLADRLDPRQHVRDQ